MADNKKDRRKDYNADEQVGSGVGVVPGDTIASALDPFGGAAAAVGESEEDVNHNKENEDNNYRSKTKD